MGEESPPWITGTVTQGDDRGRDLGFPTANIVLDNPELRPPEGVYACWATIENDETIYKGALHVGPVPTFNKKAITVELHILNFSDKDLYNKKVSFSCIEYLRNIVKFDTVKELQSALKQDCIKTDHLLTNPPSMKI